MGDLCIANGGNACNQIESEQNEASENKSEREESPRERRRRERRERHQKRLNRNERKIENEKKKDEEFPYPQQYRPHDDENEEEEQDGFDWSEFDEEEDEEMDVEKEESVNDEVLTDLTEKAQSARNEYNAINREIGKLEGELKKIEEILEMNVGEKNVFAALFDECYSTKIGKYDYEFCPFGEAKQKEGHSSTDLGKFKLFGFDEKKELRMLFEDGQKCWNGPKRSTHVLFECDAENAIVSVSEPSTCKYSMTFNTPLACKQEELEQISQLIANQFKTDL